MTPTQQIGYDAQRRGEIDPDLSRADTPAGREYRDGMRMARRDEADAVMRDGIEAATDRTRDSNPESTPPTPPAPRTLLVPLTLCGALAVPAEAISLTTSPATPNAFADPEPGAKKVRKAKPADEGQGSLFA